MARKPDRIPKWLQDLYAQGKGSDVKQLSLLDQFYRNTDAIRSDRYDRQHYNGVADQSHCRGRREIGEANEEYEKALQDEYLGP